MFRAFFQYYKDYWSKYNSATTTWNLISFQSRKDEIDSKNDERQEKEERKKAWYESESNKEKEKGFGFENKLKKGSDSG